MKRDLDFRDTSSRVFLSMQIFENEIHYQVVRKQSDLFTSTNTSDAFNKIHDILNNVPTDEYEIINLYPDEYKRVQVMLNKTIEYFESMEEYEKCSNLASARNRIFFCTKIII